MFPERGFFEEFFQDVDIWTNFPGCGSFKKKFSPGYGLFKEFFQKPKFLKSIFSRPWTLKIVFFQRPVFFKNCPETSFLRILSRTWMFNIFFKNVDFHWLFLGFFQDRIFVIHGKYFFKDVTSLRVFQGCGALINFKGTLIL